MSGEESNATATLPPAPSVAERRKARWKALIQEHIEVAERAMAERESEQDRGLRRREEELDAEQDAEAWAAAHPPRKMPEEQVEYYRRRRDEVEEWDKAKVDAVAQYIPDKEMAANLYRNLVEWSRESREHAAGIVREYEANGYVEHFEPEDFGLPPKYLNLLYGTPTRPSASCLSSL